MFIFKGPCAPQITRGDKGVTERTLRNCAEKLQRLCYVAKNHARAIPFFPSGRPIRYQRANPHSSHLTWKQPTRTKQEDNPRPRLARVGKNPRTRTMRSTARQATSATFVGGSCSRSTSVPQGRPPVGLSPNLLGVSTLNRFRRRATRGKDEGSWLPTCP